MRAVVVANGSLDPGDAAHLADADLVVAADGGACLLDRLGVVPDLLVGDLDSVDPALVERLRRDGRTTVEPVPADKDESDTELAVRRALDAGADEVVVLGALGGARVDHELANVLLLADAALRGVRLGVVRGGTRVRAVHGGDRLALGGAVGDLVTLLPVGGAADGVTTEGLRWPLCAAHLPLGRARGLSNEVVAPPAAVALTGGVLLVLETSLPEGAAPS